MNRTTISIVAMGLVAAACIEISVDDDLPPVVPDPAQVGDAFDERDFDLVDARVVRVLDGDSLIAIVDDVETEIRLEGINAPERDECLGDESRRRLEEVLDSGAVQVAGTEFDQFDRLLGTVTAGGLPVNVTLVADGLAIPLAAESAIDGLVIAAEERARALGVGIWDPLACGTGQIPEIVILSVEPNPPGRDEDALDEERVTIRNRSEVAVDLSDWVLRDESTANRFEFPAGTTLEAGADLEVVVGCTPAPDRLAWCNDRPVWNNGGDTALLLDGSGRIVDLLRYRDSG